MVAEEVDKNGSDYYDIVILGGGIAGTTLALTLSSLKLKIIVVESSNHPRFAIGESTIPTQTLIYRDLADKYNVPELKNIFEYPELRELNVLGYPKNNFWWGFHEEGKTLAPEKQLMFDTLDFPFGPDVHFLRADVDAYLASLLPKYKIEYWENTKVVGLDIKESITEVFTEGHHTTTLKAKYIVDCAGHSSFLAKKFGLLEETPSLQTNSRSIFCHFEKSKNISDVLDPHPHLKYGRHCGTQHHFFPGGWIWDIPFFNGVKSVGFVLDRDVHPLNLEISPEEEIKNILDRYPTIKAIYKDMVPIRKIIRTDRIQFRTKTILGDRFILAPHSSGFIDPLFSTGIVLTGAFIQRFTRKIKYAFENNDFSNDNFQPMEKAFFAEVDQIDRIVHGHYLNSSKNFEVFKQYWRTWVYGSLIQFQAQFWQPQTPDIGFLYATNTELENDTRKMYELMCGSNDDFETLAKDLKEIIDHWHEKTMIWTETKGDFNLDSKDMVVVSLKKASERTDINKLMTHYKNNVFTKFEFDDAMIAYRSRFFAKRILASLAKYEKSPPDSIYRRSVDEILRKSKEGAELIPEMIEARKLIMESFGV